MDLPTLDRHSVVPLYYQIQQHRVGCIEHVWKLHPNANQATRDGICSDLSILILHGMLSCGPAIIRQAAHLHFLPEPRPGAGLSNAIATQLQGGVPLIVLDGLCPCFSKPYPQALGCLFVLDARNTDANALSHNH